MKLTEKYNMVFEGESQEGMKLREIGAKAKRLYDSAVKNSNVDLDKLEKEAKAMAKKAIKINTDSLMPEEKKTIEDIAQGKYKGGFGPVAMEMTLKLKSILGESFIEAKGGTEEKKVIDIVEKLKNENWSKDNDMQEDACNHMLKLSESNCNEANDFMEYMDEMSSKYEGYGKKNEAKKKDGTAHLLGYLNEIEALLPKAKKEIKDGKEGESWKRLFKIISEVKDELWYKQKNK